MLPKLLDGNRGGGGIFRDFFGGQRVGGWGGAHWLRAYAAAHPADVFCVSEGGRATTRESDRDPDIHTYTHTHTHTHIHTRTTHTRTHLHTGTTHTHTHTHAHTHIHTHTHTQSQRQKQVQITAMHWSSREYRGTSLIRNSARLGPYSRTTPRAIRWSEGGGVLLMSEVPL